VYDTVRIGTQVWMAENLRSTLFNNGDTLGYKYSIGAAGRTYDFEPHNTSLPVFFSLCNTKN
jgi:uncharacterized protein (TIGR02145 family)